MASNARTESTDSLRYNDQIIDLADPTKYRPLQNTAFDWYPPDVNNGTHRSLDPRNRDNTNFNISRASNKSQLLYANKINSFVMNLCLNHEQRRCALWKSFSLPGMRGMVQSYGFNTSSMNIGLLIATNVQRFMQYSREATNNRWSRPTDAQRIAVNVLTAAAISTPPREVSTSDPNVRQRTTGNVTVRPTTFLWRSRDKEHLSIMKRQCMVLWKTKTRHLPKVRKRVEKFLMKS